MRRAVGYARVSTSRQAQHELSLAEQQRKIEDYCTRSGIELVDMFVDRGLSGRTTNRPRFKAMLDFLKERSNSINALIVYNSSRLFRDTRQMLDVEHELSAIGVEFLSVEQSFPGGPDGKLLKTISYALDQAQSDRNRAVVMDMMAANAEAGHWNGSTPPFGYATEVAVQVGKKQRKRLVVNQAEAQLVRLIFDLYLTGGAEAVPLGIKKIAQKLNAAGIGYRGRSFSTSNVESILKHTAYVGYSYYGVKDSVTRQVRPQSEWIKFATPVIIADRLFAEVQRRLAARNPRKVPPQVEAGPTMLSGIATCGLCGGGMQLRTGKSGAYRYLTCAKQATMGVAVCSGQSIRMDHLDEQAVSILLDEVLAPKRLAKLCDSVQQQSAELTGQLAADEERTRRAITETTRRITNLLLLAADDRTLHDDDSFRSQLANLRRQKEEQAAQLRLAEARRAAQQVDMTPERMNLFEKRVRQLLLSLDPHVRKLWVRHFVAEVVVYPDHIRIVGPNDQIVRDLNTVRDDELLVVPSFAREWRTRGDESSNIYVIEISI